MKSATQKFLDARDFLLKNREDYEKAYRDFRWPELEHFNWATDWFDVYAQGNSRTALHIIKESGEEQKISFQGMKEGSDRVAHYLQRQGIHPGDKIILCLSNVPAIWEIMLAAIKIGAVLVPTSTLATSEELADRILRSQAKMIITFKENLSRMPSEVTTLKRLLVEGEDPDWLPYEAALKETPDYSPTSTLATDPLLLYFTSGTTAKAKLVLHTHQSYPVGHLSTMYWIGIQEKDVHQNISSPGWAKHAWSSFFAPWNAGATIFVHDYSRFQPALTLQLLEQAKVNTLCAPPTVWRMLILEKLGQRPTYLRELASAGEPLNPEVIETVESAWGLRIRDGFGQTETTAQVGNSPGQKIKLGSMGRPLPGYQVRLLNSVFEEVHEGEVSLSLQPRPLGLMTAYADDPARTAQVMEHGYYRTGDEAYRDDEGYIYYVGRGDDVFKSSDYRISPFELESVLIEHEWVAEAAVIPSPDPVRTSVPKAFISLKPGIEISKDVAQNILFFAKEKLPAYKRLRKIEFTDLPKTISGKIRRVELRKLESERVRLHQKGIHEYWLKDFEKESVNEPQP